MRTGISFGLRLGVGAEIRAGDPLAGVTRDATSGKYYPASAAEWAIVLSVAGITSGGPHSVWLCQEASGSLVDVVNGVNMAQSGTGHLYQQSLTGHTRKAVKTVDGTVGQKWINSTTAANPNTTDTLELGVFEFPGVAPAAVRDVLAIASASDIRLSTTGKVRAVFGATNDLATSALGLVMPVVMQVNNTGASSCAFTDRDKLIDTYALPASGTVIAVGGHTAAAASVGCTYLAQFRGAAARWTTAQTKAVLQTLGWTVLWTP